MSNVILGGAVLLAALIVLLTMRNSLRPGRSGGQVLIDVKADAKK